MKLFERILTWIYIIFGGFVFICFGGYFIKLLFSPEGRLPWIATTAVVLAVIIPVIFRSRLRRILKKVYVPLKALMCIGFLFFFVTFLSLVIYIYNPSDTAEADKINANTVYIVFGAKVNPDGYPTSTLCSRLDAAIDAMTYNNNGVCIVSGGKGSDEPVSEGYAMKEYLISHGIDEKRIFTEEAAHNTAENIRFSKKVIEKEGLADYDIVCVSSNTHIPRIRLLCKEEGVDAGYISADFPKKSYLFANLVREYLSYSRMLLIGY